MPSLSRYIELLSRLQSTHVAVTPQRCLAVRNRNTSCHRCADACTSGCISVGENELHVDAQRCIGCGTCATACPTEALAARKPDDRDLARRAAATMRVTGGVAVITCEPAWERAKSRCNPDAVTTVPCLGRADESLITVLVGAGAREVRLVCGECDTCEHATGAAMAQRVCASANAILATWGTGARALLSPKFPRACRLQGKATYDADRRTFLRGAAEGARDAAHDATEYAIECTFTRAEDGAGMAGQLCHVGSDGALPRHVPLRRALLLEVLAERAQPADEMIHTRLFGHAVVDEDRCTGCGMCAVFCPTGALTRKDDDGTVRLVHAPGLCLQCRTCEALCPAGALLLSEEVFAVDVTAGTVDSHRIADIHRDKGGPDAIRNSMSKLINSPYVTG